MKVFGYTILKKETASHGAPWWDEHYDEEVTANIETRIFESEERRNNERDKSVEKHIRDSAPRARFESFVFEAEIEE